MDVTVPVIETVLPMGIGCGELGSRKKRSLLLVLLEERGARNGCVEHELMEIGFVRDSIINNLVDILRGVVFHADDRGAQNPNTVRLECFH